MVWSKPIPISAAVAIVLTLFGATRQSSLAGPSNKTTDLGSFEPNSSSFSSRSFGSFNRRERGWNFIVIQTLFDWWEKKKSPKLNQNKIKLELNKNKKKWFLILLEDNHISKSFEYRSLPKVHLEQQKLYAVWSEIFRSIWIETLSRPKPLWIQSCMAIIKKMRKNSQLIEINLG